jgi:hypothetical protein
MVVSVGSAGFRIAFNRERDPEPCLFEPETQSTCSGKQLYRNWLHIAIDN